MGPPARPSFSPTVSVIIPARNEEACLARCLESLVAQEDIDFEIIVVNDGSTDRTCEIAESFPGIRVVEAGSLRENWTGKNNAVFTGFRLARARWLLFTDADTVHAAGSLARAVAEAQLHQASLLSYSPQQEVRGVWEKALMPVVFAELAATYSPAEINDPASPVAAANGQYFLITRQAYEAVGGHAAVAESLLEDVDLARKVKSCGYKIHFRYADDVRTRMYRSFGQLCEGWTKNLAPLFPSCVKLAGLRFGEFSLIVCSTGAAGFLTIRGKSLPALLAGGMALILYSQLLLRIRKAHFSMDATGLSLFGLPLFSYLLLRSRRDHGRRSVEWKGRSYNPTKITTLRVGTCAPQQTSARTYS